MSTKTPSATGLPLTESVGVPGNEVAGLTEEHIRAVVDEFYRRVLLDEQLGPVFAHYVHDWDVHLARLTDFWSAALLHTGRFSGRPVERHRVIDGLASDHFERWLQVFETTVIEMCTKEHALAFMARAQRMKTGMMRALHLD